MQLVETNIVGHPLLMDSREHYRTWEVVPPYSQMKVISWNNRRLKHAHKHDLLSTLVRDHKPDICLVQ